MSDTEARREETAYHEAGHAVAFYRLGLDVESASIAPEGDSLGRVARPLPETLVNRLDVLDYSEDGREFARHMIVGAFSGVKVVEILTGCDYDPHSLDTRPMFPGSDWSELNLWLPLIGPPKEYERIYEQAWDEADRVLRESWDTVVAVAEALLERETLDEPALRTIFEYTDCSLVDARVRCLLLDLERDLFCERGTALVMEGGSEREIHDLEQKVQRIDEELERLACGREE